eukprot:1160170-Pelagomonas_calceolata.AAC.4
MFVNRKHWYTGGKGRNAINKCCTPCNLQANESFCARVLDGFDRLKAVMIGKKQAMKECLWEVMLGERAQRQRAQAERYVGRESTEAGEEYGRVLEGVEVASAGGALCRESMKVRHPSATFHSVLTLSIPIAFKTHFRPLQSHRLQSVFPPVHQCVPKVGIV